MSSITRWIALGLIGVLLTAAASLGASRLTATHVGLTSEPVSASYDQLLAPPSATGRKAPGPRTTAAPKARRQEPGEGGEPGDGDD